MLWHLIQQHDKPQCRLVTADLLLVAGVDVEILVAVHANLSDVQRIGALRQNARAPHCLVKYIVSTSWTREIKALC